MNKYASLAAIYLALLSCSEGTQGPIGAYKPGRGSAQFKSLLAQGTGRFRPLGFKPNTALGLDAGPIVSSTVDEASGAWSRVVFDTRLSDSINGGQDLIALGLDLLSRYSDKLGFLPGEAGPGALYQPNPKVKVLTYQRLYNGMPIKGAFLRFFFNVAADESMHLSEIINNSYGPVSISAPNGVPPSDAEAIAATGIPELMVESKRALIQPTLGVSGHYEFAYATEFKLKSDGDKEQFTLTMDHETRELREAYSNHLNEAQNVSVETFQRSYVLKDQSFKPLPFAEIVDGANTVVTDAQGNGTVEGKEVTISLTSDKSASSVVDVLQSNSRAASFPVTLDANGKTVIKLGSNPAPLNVFVAIQRVVDYVARFMSVQELPLLTTGIVAVVNRTEDTCNAFYDSDSLNFFAQGTGSDGKVCANTGLISDVVYHEWGHALDDFLGPNNRTQGVTGITDSAYSEGIGDILSSYLNRAPNLGTGLFLNDPKELRNLQNDRKHPPANAAEAEIHSAGMIVGGAFWDMFTAYTAAYGADAGADLATKTFLKHLQISERYLDAYAAVLQVDDDDANLATRSPNYCKITKAFAAHNITGGETAGDDCVDPDTSLNIRVDVDAGNGKLSLIASALGADKIIGCPGKVTVCKADTAGYVALAPTVAADAALALASGRKYYTAKGTVDAAANSTYSFFSLEPSGSIVGSRTLKFTGRTP